MTISNWIANRIKFICREQNLSINKLATLSILTQSTVNSIIQGESKNPKLVTIVHICRGLDITLAKFFEGFEDSDFEE